MRSINECGNQIGLVKNRDESIKVGVDRTKSGFQKIEVYPNALQHIQKE